MKQKDVFACGSCNCGAVSFSIGIELTDIYMCHCSICRKATGGAGIAVTIVPNEKFAWVSGQEAIVRWNKPGHDWLTQFCTHCGSPLPASNSETNMFVPVGLLDSGFDQLTVKHHIWVGSKAAWEIIGDDGKQHQEQFLG